MSLREEILKEHSKNQKDKIVDWVGNNQARFDELFFHVMGQEKKLSQRASWPMSYCVELHPALIGKNILPLIKKMQEPGVHNAIKRNGTRLLQFIEIPEIAEGEVLNLCFDFVERPNEDVAVKCNALSVLSGLAKKYPDIKNELLLTIEDQWDNAHAAFRARAKAVRKELSKVT